MSVLAAALVHSLWQGAALAALAATFGRLLPTASRRAAMALAGLGILALLPAATSWLILAGDRVVQAPSTGSAVPAASALGRALGSGTRAVLDGPPVVVAGIVTAWAAGAALLLSRLVLGLVGVRRIIDRGSPASARVRLAVRVAARRLGVARAIQALETDRVDVPAVVGGHRPVMLIPRGVARLDDRPSTAGGPRFASSLQVLIAHEVAHVRRGDWWMNLAQSAAEALLWFHPAAWWLSSTARREREFACDDLAATTCCGVRLARALATLEALRPRPAGLAMSAATGSLAERVSRLLPGGARGRGSVTARLRRGLACGAASVAVVVAAWATITVVPSAALASTGPISTLTAHDAAGAFTLSFRGGRVVAATLDGAALPASRLRQTADSLYFLMPDGEPSFGVRVKPGGTGISWQSRPAPASGSP